MSKRTTDVEKLEIVELYENGMGSTEIGKLFDISGSAVIGLLKRRNTPRRSNRDAHRRIILNENCFDEINEMSAYWIGFLMADGCISQRGPDSFSVYLRLHEKDTLHIKKFKKFLQTDAKIIFIKNKIGGVQLAVKSTRLAKKLFEYGVTQRKSCVTRASKNIIDNRHFWRGVFDGDGSFGSYFIKRYQIDVSHFRLYGSKDLLKQFKGFLLRNGVHSSANVIPHKSIFEYHLVGKSVISAISLLYDNASIYLDRKYTIAMSLIM